jgi:ubiquinone/menaquinone biosynthesis C-methylase UbiE
VDASEVARAWDANAGAWTHLSRAGYDVYRDMVNTPAFLAMLPSVTGQAGLDIGCGEGHNTALVAARCARIAAVDIAPRFAAATAGRRPAHPGRLEVALADGAALPFRDEAFDFAVAFMSLMDMPEPAAALREAARVLRPGGFLQFSVAHPATNTAVRRWVHDEDGRRVALATGGYFDQGQHVERWLFGAAPAQERARFEPFIVPRFPLTLAGWLNAVAGAGLAVEEACEPRASDEVLRSRPDLADTTIVPYFLLLRARKPGS